MSQQVAFVTGGTGKIGRHLVRGLLSHGFHVRVLMRSDSDPWPDLKDIQPIRGDISNSEVIKKAIGGCNYVFHLAVYQNINDSHAEMFKRVNVDGTKTLLDCALDSEVKKIIYVSTTMVFEPTGKMARDENWPKKTADGSNYYLKTKIEALAVVNRMKELLPIVVVYPTAVIDLKDFSASCPVDSAGLQKFLWEKIGRGIPGGLANLVGPKERILNYVIVEDVAEGIIKAAINAKPGEEYILGGENITAGDYLGAAAQRVNKRPFPFRLPFFLFRIMAFFGRFAGLPPVIAMIARNRSEDRCFSSRKAERELGYSPEFKL